MRTIALLDLGDTVIPTDYYRPLSRSADHCMHDEWLEESCYGGGPLDHLRWAPIWLILGKCWWGKSYSNFVNFCRKNSGGRPFEAVRGELPPEHVLSSKKWEVRHPLWYEGFLKRKKETEKPVFKVGKCKDRTIGDVMKRSDHSYLEWYVENIAPEWRDRVTEMLTGEQYKIYHEPSFKKFIK